jgi:hypothetical protein
MEGGTMRKLTVKNFSVIKDAELEFGKITVLIGPQASGKSLLCKLAYFLSKQTIDLALETILSGESFDFFRLEIARLFIDWFPINAWENDGSFVRFECGDFWVESRIGSGTGQFNLEFRFSSQFEEAYLQLDGLTQDGAGFSSDFSSDRREQIRAKFNLLLTVALPGDPFVHQALYIPGGRVFFVNSSLGFSALQNPDIDPLVREFSTKIAWGDAWRPNPIVGHESLQRLDLIRRDFTAIVGGYVEGRNTNARFRRFLDGREVPLTLLSSGTQELLPLLNVLEQMATGQRDRILFPRPNSLPGMQGRLVLSKGLIYLEEPESNVFPSTQYDLVRLIAVLSYEQILDFSWIITTHSPYILSSFNNLLEAWQVGYTDKERSEAVRKLIDEKYWVNPDEFRAYSIEDGFLKSIMDEETHLISDNYLDAVSERIGGEFDELLRIGYVEA